MSRTEPGNRTLRPGVGVRPGREYTVEELARSVGMSVRNVRAYQARGLLDPPRRVRRTVRYSDSHVDRLLLVQLLQRQGFNLAAIRITLEQATGGSADLAPDAAFLREVEAQDPRLLRELCRLRVADSDARGRVHVGDTAAVQALVALSDTGTGALTAAEVFCRLVDGVDRVAGDLMHWVEAHVPAEHERAGSRGREVMADVVVAATTVAARRHARSTGSDVVKPLPSTTIALDEPLPAGAPLGGRVVIAAPRQRTPGHHGRSVH